ncbi:MAG: cobalt transporter CbiM [Chloroflexota bacterium]
MHIPTGFIPITVAAGGYAVMGAAALYTLRKIKEAEDPRANIPKAALLTAAFFVASLIHIPVPPTSVHLILNGLLGVILGYYAFPAILVGLVFQAILFGHGGVDTFGVNAVILGLPALLAHLIFQARHLMGGGSNRITSSIFGFIAGASAIAVSTLLFFGIMVYSIPADMNAATEQAAITALSLAHIPLMLIEGTLTAMLIIYLMRVQPHLLGGLREARA